MKKKLAILGASYLQIPLITKAKDMDIETHVFAWEQGAVAKDMADYFYPVSILDKEQILGICRKIKPDGVISIASDIAMTTVNFVANELGLTGNSLQCTMVTTNKFEMRRQLSGTNIACPGFVKFDLQPPYDLNLSKNLNYPLIVKPVDRSGSRGVTKVGNPADLEYAVNRAMEESFSKSVIVEEFISGNEYSVEMISWKGKHHFLAITEKVTSGYPYFVELEQHEPANLSEPMQQKIIELVSDALTVLGVQYGGSHSELMVDAEGNLNIIEIGARMGGDNIGAKLVQMSTGYDFVKGVIEVAMGIEPTIIKPASNYAGIYYLTPPKGKVKSITLKTDTHKEIIDHEVFVKKLDSVEFPVKDSAQRSAYLMYQCTQPFRIKNPNELLVITTVPQN